MGTYLMKNRYEQVRVISGEEMETRIKKLRNILYEEDADIMLVLDGTWEGYSHWITGARAVEMVFVFLQGKTIAVYGKDMGGLPKEDAIYGHIRYEEKAELKEILGGHLKKNRIRIALVQPEAMTAAQRAEICELFCKIEFVDVTQKVDVLKAIKSETELKWIRKANRVHEKIFQALPSIIRPGRTIREVNVEMRYLGEQLGGGGEKSLYYAMQYGPDDGRPLVYAQGLSGEEDYQIGKGDRIFMMVEANAMGGLFTAIGRNFILGEPSAQTVEYWKMAVKAQNFAAAQLKPGVILKDIFDSSYQYITECGYLTNMQNYLHSFGYVFGERPYLHDRSETERLCLGMHYLVHPHIRINRGKNTGIVPYDDYYCVDTYYITEKGGKRANNCPQELICLSDDMYML